MVDGYLIGLQDVPFNVLLRVSPATTLTVTPKPTTGLWRNQLERCANPAADLFRPVPARPFEPGQNLSRTPPGSARPSLLGTNLPERRLAPMSA